MSDLKTIVNQKKSKVMETGDKKKKKRCCNLKFKMWDFVRRRADGGYEMSPSCGGGVFQVSEQKGICRNPTQ